MHVVVLGVSQGLSFETGEGFNHISLLLPDGTIIKADVDDEAVAALTALFVKGGSPAAQTAIMQAAQSPPAPPPVAQSVSYAAHPAPEPTPLAHGAYSLVSMAEGSDEDDMETVSTFGGDIVADPTLAAVGAQLQMAESKMARAIGDTSMLSPESLSGIVARIATPEPVMPVPNIIQKPTQLKVQADSMGNPIVTGPGLIDPRALMGGNTDGEEDVGQV